MSRPFHPTFPFEFDYKSYLNKQGVTASAYTSANKVILLDASSSLSAIAYASQLQKSAVYSLRKYISTDREREVAEALVLGYKEDLSQETRNSYQATGAMHVLAVSGLHVGIVALILRWLIGLIPLLPLRLRWLNCVPVIIGIWMFAFLTGASPSVLRAATMFSFLMIGLELKRPTSVYNTLAASALLLLIIDPSLIFQLGFQLSYLAVLGIVTFQPYFQSFYRPKTKIGMYVWSLMTVSLAAQMTTLPLSMYVFHSTSSMFWLSGLIVIPSATIILILGLLTILFSGIPLLAQWLGLALEKVLWMVNSGIYGLAQLPSAQIEHLYCTLPQMCVLYAAIGCFGVYVFKKTKAAFYIALAFLFCGITWISIDTISRYTSNNVVAFSSHNSTSVFISQNQHASIFQIGDSLTSRDQQTFDNLNGYFGTRINSVQMIPNGLTHLKLSEYSIGFANGFSKAANNADLMIISSCKKKFQKSDFVNTRELLLGHGNYKRVKQSIFDLQSDRLSVRALQWQPKYHHTF